MNPRDVVPAAAGAVLVCCGALFGQAATSRPAILENVGIDQNLGAPLPADARFRDSKGHGVRLGDCFDGRRPVVFTLVYFECPMMCTIVLNDLVRKMAEIPLSVGKNYEVLTISFNPAETTTLAAAKKRNYLQAYGRAGAEDGWRFLVGTPGPIAAVTRAVGFRYKFDAATNQFVHPSVVMVLTPDGRVARYFFGTGYEPKDLRLALVEASERKVGSATDSVLLWCYHYDPTRGKYTLAVMKAVRIGGAVIVAAVAALVVLLLRRERRTGTAAAGPPGSPARGSDMAGKT